MAWEIQYIKEAISDLERLDNSQRLQVLKAIKKVSENPLPINEGGYGKPLGSKSTNNLTGYLKIKLLKLGIRIVYGIVRENEIMRIVIISVREDNEVYDAAKDRLR